MIRTRDLGRYARTVRWLRPGQIGHRIRLRAQKQAYGRSATLTTGAFQTTASPDAGWPPSFRPLDASTQARGCPSLEENLGGRFHLLGQTHDLGDPIDWQPEDATQLWRYHLHYFDWAWVTLTDPGEDTKDQFATLYRSWRVANPIGRWDAWSPYVVALRAWTLCSLFEPVIRGTGLEALVRDDLAVHARYLRANMEFDVGGNHLIKNLKALIGLAIFLRDERLLRFAARHLARQLDRQVLADGGHFERSTSYHAQVLGDLIDLRELLEWTEALPGLVSRLEGAVESMQGWLSAMLQPDGSLPLVNDAIAVPPARLVALGVEEVARPSLEVLQSSGYLVGRPEPGTQWVLDVGPPCPPELPAHAHADALALLLDVDGQPVLVDTGTSTYAPGARRQYERSTPAHNTVQVDGEDQTEVWGAFRAGRRHRAILEDVRVHDDAIEATALHNGYRHLPGSPVHRRTVRSTPIATQIIDTVHGAGSHDIAVYWHLSPETLVAVDHNEVRTSAARLTYDASVPVELEVIKPGNEPLGMIALSHNELLNAPCVVLRVAYQPLPVTIRTTFHHPPPT